jgi:hypothetical protein
LYCYLHITAWTASLTSILPERALFAGTYFATQALPRHAAAYLTLSTDI